MRPKLKSQRMQTETPIVSLPQLSAALEYVDLYGKPANYDALSSARAQQLRIQTEID